MSRPSPRHSHPQTTPDPAAPLDPGEWGEQLVAQWWQRQGDLILARRWHCRWGELDLVVGHWDAAPVPSPTRLAFVEVKTRRGRNWDADGALALTPKKCQKLWTTAQLFLAQHPDWAELPCQFDVALVTYRALPRGRSLRHDELPQDDQTMIAAGYRFSLQAYIPAAFTL
jgi:putative endonuclease